MEDHPTPDQAEQDPFARTIDYTWDETSLAYVNLELRGLTIPEATRLLREVRKITGVRVRPQAHSPHIVDTGKNRGGPKGGITKHPDFINIVARVAHEHFQEAGNHAEVANILAATGASSSRYYEWLSDNNLTSSDVKLAASFGSCAESQAYLRALQQERRR